MTFFPPTVKEKKNPSPPTPNSARFKQLNFGVLVNALVALVHGSSSLVHKLQRKVLLWWHNKAMEILEIECTLKLILFFPSGCFSFFPLKWRFCGWTLSTAVHHSASVMVLLAASLNCTLVQIYCRWNRISSRYSSITSHSPAWNCFKIIQA